ncbi:MAG TPA: type II toxin-antitoxin system VapC family toxin [Thermoanaerobaculia bacterium]|jgi:Predicted nucleic acid-binding protein, contains PIN domain|nr:type II toxin-antitoxin system VapC family toxin [Thermoanaerobaculia bacterium]
MTALRYLLDTNSLSDLIRNPDGLVTRKLGTVGEDAVCTSIVVACELRFGAAKRGSPRLSARVDQLLASLEVLPLEGDADRHYAEIRAHLSRIGQPVGPNDLLIAAHTLALGLTLVTGNIQEFSRVPGLSIEDWLVPSS